MGEDGVTFEQNLGVFSHAPAPNGCAMMCFVFIPGHQGGVHSRCCGSSSRPLAGAGRLLKRGTMPLLRVTYWSNMILS